MKKVNLFLIIFGIISFVLILFFTIKPNNSLIEPLKLLQKENINLEKSDLLKLNSEFKNYLIANMISESSITYFSEKNNYEDNKYIGRFVSGSKYTYEFTINLEDKTLHIVELSNNFIDLEELDTNAGGFNE